MVLRVSCTLFALLGLACMPGAGTDRIGAGGAGGAAPGGTGEWNEGGEEWREDECHGEPCWTLGCDGTVAYDCPDLGGCAVQTAWDCAYEGKICVEYNDVLNGFHPTCEAGCGDADVQADEACDAGADYGKPGGCSFYCEPLPEPVLEARSTEADSSGSTEVGVPQPYFIILEVDVQRSGSLASLVLPDEIVAVQAWRGPRDRAEMLGSSLRVESGNAEGSQYAFEFRDPVGIRAGETIWFSASCLPACTLRVLEGNPAPTARLALGRWGSFRDPQPPALDPDLDLRFELWVHEGEVACSNRDPLERECLADCWVWASDDFTPASCTDGTWTCPDGRQQRSSCP